MEVNIPETKLQEAAGLGTDAFLKAVHDAILSAIGGEVNAETLPLLNGEQTTLLAYFILREEVMDGGFIQLIHNGYGPFIFLNPFAKAMRIWGAHEFSKLIYKGRKLFETHEKALTAECSDEEFMALFEKYPEFDDLDDLFVESEDAWMDDIAHYIDDNLEKFAVIQ